jgi:hypothetical protein
MPVTTNEYDAEHSDLAALLLWAMGLCITISGSQPIRMSTVTQLR